MRAFLSPECLGIVGADPECFEDDAAQELSIVVTIMVFREIGREDPQAQSG